MIRQIGPGRTAIFALALGFATWTSAAPAMAQDHRARGQSQSKPAPAGTAAKAEKPGKPDSKAARGKAAAEPAKPGALGEFGDWTAYAAGSGKAKTCYALGKPRDRKPELKREDAYLFVSTRPKEGVTNEISIVMGFEVKPDSKSTATVGSASFELVPKGSNLWLAAPTDEPKLVKVMREGASLVVKAPSKRGSVTTDTYSLKGLGQALDRVGKECS